MVRPEAGDQPRRARRRTGASRVGFDLDTSKLLVPAGTSGGGHQAFSSRFAVGARSGPTDRGGRASRVWQDDVAGGAREAEVEPSGVAVGRRSRQRPGRPLHVPRGRARWGGARRAESVPLDRDSRSRRCRRRPAGLGDCANVRACLRGARQCRAAEQRGVPRHDRRARAPASRGLAAGDRIANGRCPSPSRASARNDASSRSAETTSRWMPRRRVHCSTAPVSQCQTSTSSGSSREPRAGQLAFTWLRWR